VIAVEKRESILNAAIEAFGRFGYRRVSVDDIARAAGVAKGTVYLVCESKDELYFQAVLRETRDFLAASSRSFDPRTPADKLLEQCARDGIALLERHPLVRELLAARADETQAQRARFAQIRDLTKNALAEILRIGVRQGVFRANLDIDSTATILRDMQAADYIFNVVRGENPGDHARYLERALATIRLLLDGLRAR
jgi:AcrR family transcriptional regulator